MLCHYAECNYAVSYFIYYYAECHSAECRYAECHHAERRGASQTDAYCQNYKDKLGLQNRTVFVIHVNRPLRRTETFQIYILTLYV